MDNKSGLWKKKSSEKTSVADKANISLSINEEELTRVQLLILSLFILFDAMCLRFGFQIFLSIIPLYHSRFTVLAYSSIPHHIFHK